MLYLTSSGSSWDKHGYQIGSFWKQIKKQSNWFLRWCWRLDGNWTVSGQPMSNYVNNYRNSPQGSWWKTFHWVYRKSCLCGLFIRCQRFESDQWNHWILDNGVMWLDTALKLWRLIKKRKDFRYSPQYTIKVMFSNVGNFCNFWIFVTILKKFWKNFRKL